MNLMILAPTTFNWLTLNWIDDMSVPLTECRFGLTTFSFPRRFWLYPESVDDGFDPPPICVFLATVKTRTTNRHYKGRAQVEKGRELRPHQHSFQLAGDPSGRRRWHCRRGFHCPYYSSSEDFFHDPYGLGRDLWVRDLRAKIKCFIRSYLLLHRT